MLGLLEPWSLSCDRLSSLSQRAHLKPIWGPLCHMEFFVARFPLQVLNQKCYQNASHPYDDFLIIQHQSHRPPTFQMGCRFRKSLLYLWKKIYTFARQIMRLPPSHTTCLSLQICLGKWCNHPCPIDCPRKDLIEAGLQPNDISLASCLQPFHDWVFTSQCWMHLYTDIS